MDLNVLAEMRDSAGDNPAKGLLDGIMSMHTLLRKIELAGMDRKTQKGGKPIAAALPGTAMGIGSVVTRAASTSSSTCSPSWCSSPSPARPSGRSTTSAARAEPGFQRAGRRPGQSQRQRPGRSLSPATPPLDSRHNPDVALVR